MRIKNESKRTFCFSGGQVAAGKVVDIKDEKIANILLKNYPTELIALDKVEVEVIEPVSNEEKDALIAKAKELGVKGNVAGMKVETLKAKIAELSE